MSKRGKVYIAGKVSGTPYQIAYSKFMKYEYFYYKQDYDVVNPMRICRENWSWLRCMVKCVCALSRCRRVAFMPDWLQSRGARVEMIAALILGKQIEFSIDMP